MCGIIGAFFIEKTKEELLFLKKLMNESSVRGLHAFGVCFYDKKYEVIKSNKKDFSSFIDEFEKSNAISIMFHNRYSTSGDHKIENNNQPIVVNNVGSIVMNGIISMKTKEQFEKQFDVICDTENDAEILLRKMEKDVDVIDFLSSTKCSFAGIIMEKEKMFGVRNNKRPLYIYKSKKANYFVSTLDIVARAGGNILRTCVIPPLEKIKIGEV